MFIQHVIKVCHDVKVDSGREKEWVKQVKKEINRGHYFEGMIFMKSMSLYLFIHELTHHVARLLRGHTNSWIFYEIDWFVDRFDIWLFNKE